MRRLLALLLLACAFCPLMAKEAPYLAQDPAVEKRLIDISEEMRCLVCQNESLAASQADLAKDLRQELREQIKAGKSDAEIRDFMVSRYGDFVLYRPPVKSTTWLLWLGPFVGMLCGLIALAFFLRSRRRDIQAAPSTLTAEELKTAEQLMQDGSK